MWVVGSGEGVNGKKGTTGVPRKDKVSTEMQTRTTW